MRAFRALALFVCAEVLLCAVAEDTGCGELQAAARTLCTGLGAPSCKDSLERVKSHCGGLGVAAKFAGSMAPGGLAESAGHQKGEVMKKARAASAKAKKAAKALAKAGSCWSKRLDGKYVSEQHGKTNECYDLNTAKAKCARAADCKAIARQTNVCGGKYRVTHGGPTLKHYANWKTYKLWAYTLDRACLTSKSGGSPRACVATSKSKVEANGKCGIKAETRIAPDGKPYSKAEFRSFFKGSLKEWNTAIPSWVRHCKAIPARRKGSTADKCLRQLGATKELCRRARYALKNIKKTGYSMAKIRKMTLGIGQGSQPTYARMESLDPGIKVKGRTDFPWKKYWFGKEKGRCDEMLLKYGWLGIKVSRTEWYQIDYVKVIATADQKQWVTLKKFFNCYSVKGTPGHLNECFGNNNAGSCRQLRWSSSCTKSIFRNLGSAGA